MDILQTALVLLVLVWTTIFVFIAVAAYLVYRSVKRAMDKVNNVLEATEEIAENAKIPSKIAMAAVVAFLAKNSVEGIRGLLGQLMRKKK